ncbi:MAG: L-serine ammonia-lyase, iron-sulfur-dependent, subunit alpha [Elusimicrobiaceae bacterium]|nr:L-serine ammonia-lyase, iron-sulfur-dependent, subunit alpha [Elusimicrobiaceae bacterium]
MGILKEVLKNQVYPAMGCTEPVSVALCAAHAAKILGEPATEAVFILDAGTYKNGLGVNVPNTGGEKGNLIAGALGLLIAEPGAGMEILKAATPKLLERARGLVASGRVKASVEPLAKTIYIEVRAAGGKNRAVCTISASHTEVSFSSRNGKTLTDLKKNACVKKNAAWRKELTELSLAEMVKSAESADKEDLDYIKAGVKMNLAASRCGRKLKKVGFYIAELVRMGYLHDDVFSSTKMLTAYASDARMEGLPIPVMASGESGNQGIVAILAPYNFGKVLRVRPDRIYRSIALSHLLNSYVKTYTGGLAPICGCSIAAGVGATAAMVYQLKGPDLSAISLAINNLISDLGGMLCDGAKSGCALKIVSSVDSSIRSAYMGMHNYGITEVEGFIGRTAEETIRNLAHISTVGMEQVDPTIVDIMLKKQDCRRA